VARSALSRFDDVDGERLVGVGGGECGEEALLDGEHSAAGVAGSAAWGWCVRFVNRDHLVAGQDAGHDSIDRGDRRTCSDSGATASVNSKRVNVVEVLPQA
jgi:hypothetical protein